MKLNPCTAIVDVDGTVCGDTEAFVLKDPFAKSGPFWDATCNNCINGTDECESEADAITLWNLNNKLATEEER